MTIPVAMLGKFICTFSYGKVKGNFWDKDQISSGEDKGRGKRGYGGEAQNEGYFCKIPIIQQDTNFISQNVGQTNFKSPPLQLAYPEIYMLRLSSDLEQFFPVKNKLLTSTTGWLV